MTVAQRAANDAAQHVTAPLVGRENAVIDKERRGAGMIRDHLQRVGPEVGGAGYFRGGSDQGPEQVDLVIAGDALQHRCGSLQPHARVHGRLGQRGQFSGFVAVILHEHQVPDFNEAVALVCAHAGRAAFNPRSVVVEDLRTGAAGTGVAHRPEVAAGAQAGDARIVEPGHLLPALGRLVVVLVDRDQQPLGGQRQVFGYEFPCQADGLLLEIVSETEIAQHLEERVVPGRVPHVFQVIVLAARPEAALHGHRARVRRLVAPQEDVLELHHAGVGEQQRGVVMRDQRRTGQMPVVVPLKELHERGADFGGFHEPVSPRTARTTWASENPRPRRNRAWRAISFRSAGGASPNLPLRTAAARRFQSTPASPRAASIKPAATPRCLSCARILRGPCPRSRRERRKASVKRSSLTRSRRASWSSVRPISASS